MNCEKKKLFQKFNFNASGFLEDAKNYNKFKLLIEILNICFCVFKRIHPN